MSNRPRMMCYDFPPGVGLTPTIRYRKLRLFIGVVCIGISAYGAQLMVKQPVEERLTLPVQYVTPVEINSFDQRWFPTYAFPVPVRIEKIHVEPAPEPMIEKAHTERAVRLKRNVCERHNLRKVQIGKRWRCRK